MTSYPSTAFSKTSPRAGQSVTSALEYTDYTHSTRPLLVTYSGDLVKTNTEHVTILIKLQANVRQ